MVQGPGRSAPRAPRGFVPGSSERAPNRETRGWETPHCLPHRGLLPPGAAPAVGLRRPPGAARAQLPSFHRPPPAGEGAVAGGGRWARLPRAEARAPPRARPPSSPLPSPGRRPTPSLPAAVLLAAFLSRAGWARSRLGWARRAAGGGGRREGAGRQAGGRGRRGASGASPEGARSSDEGRDGAAAPGRASSATPQPPPSESEPAPGSPRRRAQGWGGTGRGKVGRTAGAARTRLGGQGLAGPGAGRGAERGAGAHPRAAGAGRRRWLWGLCPARSWRRRAWRRAGRSASRERPGPQRRLRAGWPAARASSSAPPGARRSPPGQQVGAGS